jgi:hypothetical protein
VVAGKKAPKPRVKSNHPAYKAWEDRNGRGIRRPDDKTPKYDDKLIHPEKRFNEFAPDQKEEMPSWSEVAARGRAPKPRINKTHPGYNGQIYRKGKGGRRSDANSINSKHDYKLSHPGMELHITTHVVDQKSIPNIPLVNRFSVFSI